MDKTNIKTSRGPCKTGPFQSWQHQKLNIASKNGCIEQPINFGCLTLCWLGESRFGKDLKC